MPLNEKTNVLAEKEFSLHFNLFGSYAKGKHHDLSNNTSYRKRTISVRYLHTLSSSVARGEECADDLVSVDDVECTFGYKLEVSL